jgi:autotransporter-associated beta strand protein
MRNNWGNNNNTSTLGLTKVGTGTLTLSGANTFTGNVLISEGELQTSATNNIRSLGSDTAGRTITVSSGATLKFLGSDTLGNAASTPNPSLLISGTVTNVAGKLNTLGDVTLSGGLLTNLGGIQNNYQAYSLAGSVTVNGSAASSITTTGTTFTGVHLGTNTDFNVGDVTSSAATDLTISAPLINRNGEFGNGAGGLTKSGAGTMVLSATNTYTGATTISGTGKLIVNGNISTSVLTTVQTGATLGGSGTVGALTIDSGGFFSPGNSPGIETVNGAYTQNGTLQVEIEGLTAGNGTGFHDQVIVNGTVTLNGLLSLTTFSGTYAANDLIFILLNDNADAVSGTFTGLAQGDVAATHGGFDWLISYTGNSAGSAFTGGNDVVLMAVPEPHAALLGGLGTLLLLRRRR